MEQAVLPQILCPPVKFLMVEPHQRPGGVVLQVHLLLRPAQIQTERPPARPPLPNGDQIPEALLRQRPVQLLLALLQVLDSLVQFLHGFRRTVKLQPQGPKVPLLLKQSVQPEGIVCAAYEVLILFVPLLAAVRLWDHPPPGLEIGPIQARQLERAPRLKGGDIRLGVSGANQRPVRVPPPAFQRLKGALHIVSHFLFRHAPSPHIQAPRLLPGAFCGPFPQERPGISSVKRPSLSALYSSNRILAIRSVSTSPPEIRKPRFFPTASSRR